MLYWHRFQKAWPLLVLVLGIALSPALASHAWLNWAQLKRLQGDTSAQAFERAIQLNPTSAHMRWQAAQVHLANGNGSAALALLVPVENQIEFDPLMRADLISAYSLVGNSKEVMGQARNPSLVASQWLTDTLTWALLEQGDIAQALQVRPSTLYANLNALQHADSSSSQALRQQLSYFPIAELLPANRILLKYVALAIPELLRQQIWDQSIALHAAEFIVWQCPESSYIRPLLEELALKYPTEPIWSKLQNELNRRQTTSIKNTVVQATYLSENSKNLLPRPLTDTDYWQRGGYAGTDTPSANFFIAPDPLEGPAVTRFMNIWQRPAPVPPYGELDSQEIFLQPGITYEFSVRYRTFAPQNTSSPPATAFVALLEYVGQPRYTAIHTELPATNGEWLNWHIKFHAPEDKNIPLRLILRMLGTGNVWFANPQIQADK